MSADLKDQYDKIYRFCCLKVNNPVIAEDITQETFLRFLENPQYTAVSEQIKILYTIAGNLCTDEFRRKQTVPLPDDLTDETDSESIWNEHIMLKNAVYSLPEN
ncbi:MAG: RNA polymerase sigma factor, partial [Ruminococcus sp.]